MDFTAVGNEFVDFGVRTAHPCARCVSQYGKGDVRYLGHIGCTMLPKDMIEDDLFEAWTVQDGDTQEKYMKCMRCFLSSSECIAVPPVFKDEIKKLEAPFSTITKFQKQEAERRRQGDGEASAASSSRVVTRDQMIVAKATIRDVAQPISNKLGRPPFIPQSEKLFLHSGAVLREENPNSAVRPTGRSRTVHTAVAKEETKKRKMEKEVASALEAPTPRNKKGKVDSDAAKRKEIFELLNEKCEVLNELERAHVGLTGKAKGASTKKIKKLEDELARIGRPYGLFQNGERTVPAFSLS